MKKKSCPGVWDTSAGGHIDTEEDYDSAAKRELEEELGIKNVELKFLFKLSPGKISGKEFVKVYTCIYNGKINFDREEVSEVKFLPPESLVTELGASNCTILLKGILKKYLE